MKMRRCTLVLLLVTSVACASGNVSGESQRGMRDAITFEEIQRSSAGDAYELVQSLRPSWLRQRGRTSIVLPSPIRVYLNGVLQGELDALRRISASTILRLEHLGASAATRRFGTGHASGAILVTTQ